VTGMREAVRPLAAPGVYVNALDGDPHGAEAAYGPSLARLREVKRRWDPDRVFPGAADV
jgi:berberine-like enzyme